jgi:hypothetical protein
MLDARLLLWLERVESEPEPEAEAASSRERRRDLLVEADELGGLSGAAADIELFGVVAWTSTRMFAVTLVTLCCVGVAQREE